MAKILITGTLHPSAIEALRSLPEAIVLNKPECSKEELYSLVEDVDVLVTRSETAVDADLFAKAKQLRIVARAAVGVANIDLAEATRRGILVLNTPGQNTNSAAELTLGLLLSMFRKIPEAHQHVLDGEWERHRFLGHELKDKTIGIVGLGNVGHRVALFAHGFEMRVVGYDPYISDQRFKKYDVEPCRSLKELCERVDVLTVHTPLNSETRGLIDRSLLQMMKPQGWVLNVARGGIIDEDALLSCLQEEHIAAAGIDTWVGEPEISKDLVEHPRVYKTPHIGATTVQAQKAIADEVVKQIGKALNGSVVDSPVNFPLSLEDENPLNASYAVLAEKLARFIGQVLDFQPNRMILQRQGALAQDDGQLIKLGWMKGYAHHKVDGYVSYVNAEDCFQRLGVSLQSESPLSTRNYHTKGDLWVIVENDHSEALMIGGTVYDGQHMRLTDLNGFQFDVNPQGCFLVIENEDKPGVIGQIGTVLGRCGMNIDSFDLSRKTVGGDAMALIRVDEFRKDALDKLAALPHIRKVRQVSID
ncbi:MAG: phosphoglycerate dehydrogenase [Oligoflexales bacterium]